MNYCADYKNQRSSARAERSEAKEGKPKTSLDTIQRAWTAYGQFTPDGKRFVVLSRPEKGVNVFDLETEKIVARLKYPADLCRTDIHPDNKTVVTGSVNGKILVWNIDDGSTIREIPGHSEKSFVEAVRFSADGSFFASGASDRTAAIWDTATGKEQKRLIGHTATVWSVDLAPDGRTLATCAEDGSVRLWEVKTGKELHCMTGHTDKKIHEVAFNHKGTILASGSSDCSVFFWDVRTGKALKRLIGTESGVVSLDFSPDDSQLVVGCVNGFRTIVWDVETLLPLYRLPAGGDWVTAVRFGPDGKTIATRSNGPTLIWESYSKDSLKQAWQELQRERETAKNILLVKMPLESAQVPYGWSYGKHESSRHVFENSLWAHASSTYVYRLDRKWKTFETSYGVTKHTGRLHLTNCVFIAKGDGRELFRSEEIKDALDRPLKLDVSGVDRLELIVDPNGPNSYDKGIWYSPALSR